MVTKSQEQSYFPEMMSINSATQLIANILSTYRGVTGGAEYTTLISCFEGVSRKFQKCCTKGRDKFTASRSSEEFY